MYGLLFAAILASQLGSDDFQTRNRAYQILDQRLGDTDGLRNVECLFALVYAYKTTNPEQRRSGHELLEKHWRKFYNGVRLVWIIIKTADERRLMKLLPTKGYGNYGGQKMPNPFYYEQQLCLPDKFNADSLKWLKNLEGVKLVELVKLHPNGRRYYRPSEYLKGEYIKK